MNTGEVVAGTEERLATGDAVNVAARLEQAAPPGSVLLGPETLRLVRHGVEVEALEPLELKGKADPVPAYRLLSVTARAQGITRRNEGPFVDNGSCFYWIHTHTGDGVVHIESPLRRRFTLGDFFAIWQLPLSASQVGPVQGQVITYINGQRDATSPPDIPLLPHARIQLDVGGDVPPYPFDFPPGD